LDHETGESLECSWDADGWADLNKNTLGSVDVDLELAGLVDRRIEEGKETLRVVSTHCDVGSQAVKPDGLYPVGHR
jgi:hypothetical protein